MSRIPSDDAERPATGSPRILLLHGSGLGNVGDSAQMLSAMQRLQRIIPGCRIVVARMYAADDGRLWGQRESAPSLHLYVCRPSRCLIGLTAKLVRVAGASRLAGRLELLPALARATRLLAAGWWLRLVGVLPVANRTARAAVASIRSCDLVYCSGGGNLNDIWLRGELLPRALTYRLAALMGKPVIVSGQGIGPIHSRLGKWLLRRGARDVHMLGCRDIQESRAFLLRLGFPETVALSLGDDATDLRPVDSCLAARLMAEESLPADDRPVFAVHIRLHDFRHDFRGMAVPLLVDLCDRLVERMGCRLLFMPVTYWRDRAFEGDIGDAFDVYARMEHRADAGFVCRRKYSPSEMKGIVGRCRMMVAFSYHAWVFAMTSGVPAFGLYHGEYFRMKAEGFFRWFDRPDWAWDIETADVSAILRTIGEVASDYERHREHLLGATEKMVERVEIPARLAARCLQIAETRGARPRGRRRKAVGDE